MFSLARLLSPVPGRVWLDAPGRHGYKGEPPPPATNCFHAAPLWGEDSVGSRRHPSPALLFCAAWTEEDAAGAVPVVEVLPHVLRQDHHQVVDVVVFVGRDPCGGKHVGELDLPALPCPTPGTKKAASPPWEQRNVWLVMGPGSAKVLNLLSHSRDT